MMFAGLVISYSVIFIGPIFTSNPIVEIIIVTILLFYTVFMFIVFRTSNDFSKTAWRCSWYFLFLVGVAIMLIILRSKDLTF
jgi:hypothetical protein